MKKPNMLEAKKRQNKKVDYTTYKEVKDQFGNNKKYFVRTYGCQMNEHDSENISALLEKLGFQREDEIYSNEYNIQTKFAYSINIS